MIDVISFDDKYRSFPKFEGLKKVVLFPNGEYRKNGMPNSSVWLFDTDVYKKDILQNDVGCGMSAFSTDEIDHVAATDLIAEYLSNKGILGRGNHFVDICGSMDSVYDDFDNSKMILIIHTDGKLDHKVVPNNISEAIERQRGASEFRKELGYELANLIGTKAELVKDWTHNSVEIGDYVIYRKGVIKTVKESIHLLPAHLGAKVLFYTTSRDLPPFDSMPHATGRSAPRGESKVDIEKVKEIRNRVYIPKLISDASLRSEHPSCYYDFSIFINNSKLRKYIIPVGETKILGYVGKI